MNSTEEPDACIYHLWGWCECDKCKGELETLEEEQDNE
jgi:hypothetical protein